MKPLLILALIFSSFGFAAEHGGLVKKVKIELNNQHMTILANSFAQTVYIFDLDTGGKSACSALCAEKWPPLLISQEEAGALPREFGFIVREGNLFQLSYLGRPLYTFYLDRNPGTILGNGLGKVWHIVPVSN